MQEFLRCLLLPIQDIVLLVPYSAVSEIIEIQDQDRGEHIVWRGITVPVINHMNINYINHKCMMAIFNGLSEQTAVNFFGLILTASPTMHRYKRRDIEYLNSDETVYGWMRVKARTQIAFIPNLSFLSGGFRFSG